MLLTKVTLKNFGVYRDQNIFEFDCTENKPIILFGGTNGSGKTTLFESIKLCLYGINFFDKRQSQKDYEKFLATKIHRYLGTPKSADHASIIIEFELFHNNQINEYSIERYWESVDDGIFEKLTIMKKDNKTRNYVALDSVEESQWQSFIEEIIPRGVVNLFFFDGEKIVKMAEGGRQDIEIKSSFDVLLGLDLVGQLQADLRVHLMRNTKGNSNSNKTLFDNFNIQKEKNLTELGDFREKQAQKIDEIDKKNIRNS